MSPPGGTSWQGDSLQEGQGETAQEYPHMRDVLCHLHCWCPRSQEGGWHRASDTECLLNEWINVSE